VKLPQQLQNRTQPPKITSARRPYTGRANPSDLVSSEVALTSATMQEGQYCPGTYELLSSVGGVVARRVRIDHFTAPYCLGHAGDGAHDERVG
jgi:hypothetical protein